MHVDLGLVAESQTFAPYPTRQAHNSGESHIRKPRPMLALAVLAATGSVVVATLESVRKRQASAFLKAVTENDVQCVRATMQSWLSDCAHDESIALFEAARRGSVEMVQMLLQNPRVDCSARQFRALMGAVENGHTGAGSSLRAPGA
jgi:hypothetical protein